MTGEARRRPSWGGLIWTAVWTFPLLDPLGNATGPVPVVGLAVFTVLYVLVAASGFEWPAPDRVLFTGYGLVAALGTGLALAYGGHFLIVMLYVAVAGISVFGGGRVPYRPLAVLVLAVVATVAIGLVHHVGVGDIAGVAIGTVLSSGLVFVVRQMGRLITELRDTREALAVAAVAEERLRFSRDLHDLLGHTLSVIVVKAEVVRRLAERNPAEAAAQAADIEDIGRRALVEIREAVTGYREAGLTSELTRARAALSAAGITTTVLRTAEPLPAATDTLLAWVVREATTNVVRHSRASSCEIEIATAEQTVSVAVRDDGTFEGFTAQGVGNGLRGLTERLEAAGGTLQTGAGETGGFALLARVPIGWPS